MSKTKKNTKKYILENKEKYSKGQIDKQLLEIGVDRKIIDDVWKKIEKPKSKFFSNFIAIIILGLICYGGYYYYINNSPTDIETDQIIQDNITNEDITNLENNENTNIEDFISNYEDEDTENNTEKIKQKSQYAPFITLERIEANGNIELRSDLDEDIVLDIINMSQSNHPLHICLLRNVTLTANKLNTLETKCNEEMVEGSWADVTFTIILDKYRLDELRDDVFTKRLVIR